MGLEPPPPLHKTATGLKIYISSMLIVFDEKSNGYQYSQDWTAGLTLCIKIIFTTKSKIPLPVSLYPAFDQSVLVSTSWLRTTLYNKLNVITTCCLLCNKRRWPVSILCEGSSMVRKSLGIKSWVRGYSIDISVV